MTSIDELFKKPSVPNPNKRKLSEAPSRSHAPKSAKLSANGDANRTRSATVEDTPEDDEGEYGPPLPAEDDTDYGPQAPAEDEEEDDDDEDGRFFGGGVDRGTASALDYLDTHDAAGDEYVPEKIDKTWLRKTALNFEKRINTNAELRSKFEDEPEKFMASEADLDADVKALSILSENPNLYEEFARLGCLGSLVGLLAHENTDIAIDAMEIIAELTDEEVPAEPEQWDKLVDALLDADLLSLLMSNLDRLDEKAESDRTGVYHSLSILENLASRSRTAILVGKEANVLRWLLYRIQKKESPVGQNKEYASEVLSILLSSSTDNVTQLLSAPDSNAIDILLQLLSSYRKRDPAPDTLEEEYVEDLFNALTLLMSHPKGKSTFVSAEGVELALIMLREGKFSKSRALRVLDHAASTAGGATEEAREVCEKIVEAAGLKTLFSMIMKKQDSSTMEHLLGLFLALLRSLPGDSPPRIRTLAKFVEKDYEKLAKIVSFRKTYASRLANVNTVIATERRNLSAGDNEQMADEWLSRRLDAGLSVFQTINVILAWLVAEDEGAKKRIASLLNESKEGLNVLKATLREQLDGLEEEKVSNDEDGARAMLSTLIEFLE